MSVNTESIEAAARALHEFNPTFAQDKWDATELDYRSWRREQATAAMAAAVPIMTESAWDKGYAMGVQCETQPIRSAQADLLRAMVAEIQAGEQKLPGLSAYEYNTGLSDLVAWHEVADWLRARADALEGKSE